MKSKKRYLYKLLDYLLENKMIPWDFCNEFHKLYDLEIDSKFFSEKELKVFAELSTVAGRFSDNEKDKVKYPKAYFYK